MKFKRLFSGTGKLGLAGLVMAGAGKTEKVSAQEVAEAFANSGRANVQNTENSSGFAKDNGYIARVGGYNKSEDWTNGSEANRTPPKVSKVGVYVELGHGFGPNCTGYIQVGAENTGIGQGMVDPDNPGNTFDISPNHLVPMIAGGVRVKKDSKNKRFAVIGDVKYTTSSEFMDYARWRGGNYSEIMVDSNTELKGSVVGLVRPGCFNNFEFLGDTEVFGGASIRSCYIRGRTETFDKNGVKVVGELYPRDKAHVSPEFGINYGSFSARTDGKSIDLSVSKGF